MQDLKRIRLPTAMGSLKGLLVVPLLWAPAGLAAELPVQKAQEYLELDEVLVQGHKPVNNVPRMTAWLSRLVGDFRYEGHVERHNGETFERVEVQGSSQCANIGAPGLVQCLMNVSWPESRDPRDREMPGGVSYMIPAVALYGIHSEPIRPGQIPESQYIDHMQVDSRGLAETGMGQLFEDTLIYKTRCADLPGNCERVVHIEAPPDGKVVRISVDVERDSKLEVRYFFQWNRVPQSLAASNDSGPVVSGSAGAIVPTDTQAWLRRLVGTFSQESVTEECLRGPSSPLQPPTEGPGSGAARLPCTLDKSGKVECLGIGSGPGVRCMRNMGWQESRVPASRGNPMYELFGYDPIAQRIVHARAFPHDLEDVGGTIFHSGKLGSNTLTTPPPCKRPFCSTAQITISSDGGYVKYVQLVGGGAGEVSKRVRIGNSSAESTPDAPKVRSPSPRRP